MELFITNSRAMISAEPSACVTLSYSKKKKVPVVRIKVSSAVLGKVVKYRTGKAKELSKIMTHLGPYGVNGAVGAGSLMANSVYEV